MIRGLCRSSASRIKRGSGEERDLVCLSYGRLVWAYDKPHCCQAWKLFDNSLRLIVASRMSIPVVLRVNIGYVTHRPSVDARRELLSHMSHRLEWWLDLCIYPWLFCSTNNQVPAKWKPFHLFDNIIHGNCIWKRCLQIRMCTSHRSLVEDSVLVTSWDIHAQLKRKIDWGNCPLSGHASIDRRQQKSILGSTDAQTTLTER